jgi:hypothetical protein
MTQFTIPGSAIQRLSRLIHATDDSTPGPLSHIALRASASFARFTATNGRLLASLLLDAADAAGLDSEQVDLIIDAAQFTAACKLLGKHAKAITFTINGEAREARVSAGTTSAVIRCHEGTFPSIDHIWSRTAGQQWVPSCSSLDPALIAVAQSIIGKGTRILFSSPMPAEARMSRLWSGTVPADVDQDAAPSLSSLHALVRAPAYWCDSELAILIMPITRVDSEQQLDFSAFAFPLPTPAASAAA